MKLVMVGTGYVGLVTGVCFAEFGHDTICVDKDEARILKLKKSKCPFFEPGMDELLSKHINKTKLLNFTSSLSEAMHEADVVCITVGTPSRRLEDDADLSAVWKVAEAIASNIKKYTLIVMKSTVPVGTTKEIKKIISTVVAEENFDVVANPEFLREGSAINDFMRPDRIVIGSENEKSQKIMKDLYSPLSLLNTPIILTKIETAEIIKYASNSFLATKIAFINEVADLCENIGGDVEVVAKAMGLDKRIGSKFLEASPGYGGSCFPKDVKAFSSSAKKYGVDLSIVKAVDSSNTKRIKKIAEHIICKLGDNLEGKKVCLLGLSYKANTDDIRDSASIIIGRELLKKRLKIKCFDPKAMNNGREILAEIDYCNSANEAFVDVEAIIIATEWKEFRDLDLKEIKEKMSGNIIFDLRNIFDKNQVINLGFEYYGIGK